MDHHHHHPLSPNQAVSDVSSKDVEDQPCPSEPEEDREYGCKYCNKKFSNKQALGGHQNAHKVERAVEKTAREMHSNARLGYYLGPGPVDNYPGPFHSPYGRSQDFVNRSIFNFPFNVSHGPPLHLGCGGPRRRDAQFLGFPNTGAGRTSGHSEPFFQDLLGFGAPRMRGREDAEGGQNRPGMDNPEANENSSLDLSLKL